ncbi:MAG: protoporphyrinogen oxidase [Corynebacterium sp.]|nr:protoporphyrinogen oxidase [Corynebacterium sp.]
MTSVAIIGAGLAGLVAAYELRKQADAHQLEVDIKVFEATDRIGGKLFTVPFQAGPTEMGAEAFLAFRTDAVDFFTELGLSEQLREPSGMPSMFYVGGELHPMPKNNVMGIPATSAGLAELVSAETCARIDGEAHGDPFEWELGAEISVGQLVRERYGADLVSHVVSALQGGVYSSTSDDLGVRATIPALAHEFDRMVEAGEPVYLSTAIANLLERRAERNKARGYTPQAFAAFEDGYASVYETLAEKSGAEIHIDAFITGIKKHGEQLSLQGAEGSFDYVLLATPAPTAAMLLREYAPGVSIELSKIHLASSVVVGMRFADDTGLPDYSGILVGTDTEDISAKAFTFSSKKWPHIGARGGAVVRASFGRYHDDGLARADEDELVDRALADLKTITGFDGVAAGLEEIFVQRWFGGLPVYSTTHLDTVDRVVAGLDEYPQLRAFGAWRGGVGVPDVIATARAQAQELIEAIK